MKLYNGGIHGFGNTIWETYNLETFRPLRYIDMSVQERRYSSALSMELCLSGTNPLTCPSAWFRGNLHN